MVKTKQLLAVAALLLALSAVSATAQAESPKWYLGTSPVAGSTAVLLKSKLSFHYTDEAKHKYVSKCLATAEGTISNSGAEGAGIDELTKGEVTECVTKPAFCQPGVTAKVELNFNSPWPSHLVAGAPVRDEMFVNEVAVFCLGRNKSSNGWVTPRVKTGGLVFDKGHGNLLFNGGITISGTWKILPLGKQKITAK